jgi:hypothetical protein
MRQNENDSTNLNKNKALSWALHLVVNFPSLERSDLFHLSKVISQTTWKE